MSWFLLLYVSFTDLLLLYTMTCESRKVSVSMITSLSCLCCWSYVWFCKVVMIVLCLLVLDGSDAVSMSRSSM